MYSGFIIYCFSITKPMYIHSVYTQLLNMNTSFVLSKLAGL